ncbi:MAG: pilus assembly protein [Deltaproteobacteria bacterium CG_4_9_14_3_um_filter_44_9]|nr:MAG: pilus assembly protein [Deltaproteobacteria bacterium CG06_land_8_20_14_3_00_44_19]PJB40385.1 MAG: pilus assembly protein [Deltaproteobacteria bacterium CG_4_9_14_3_um_filter_44_9]
MKRRIILDTGPLVAFINGKDKYHKWATLQWAQIEPPLLTCEAVLSEACFLLGSLDDGQIAVLKLLQRRILHIPFRLIEHVNQIAWLLQKYSNVPISLADACLVRMTEVYAESPVLTLDTDFSIYRKNKRQIIPILSPHDL